MTTAEWVSILTVLVASSLAHLAIAIRWGGMISERVRNLNGWVKDIDRNVKQHETRIAKLEGRYDV